MARKVLIAKPLYPAMLIVFFVLHGFVENFHLIPLEESLYVLGTYFVVLLGCFGIAMLLFKSADRAALYVFLFMAFNFFFGYFYDRLKVFLGDVFILKYSFVIGITTLFFIAIAIKLKSRRAGLLQVNRYLNLAFFLFLLIDLCILAKKTWEMDDEHHPIGDKTKIRDQRIKQTPDVYLIVVDEYGGNKGLLNLCGYDNSYFLDSLRRLGFFVADSSNANYGFTTFSMASVLNMGYLEMTEEQLKKADHTAALKYIFDNVVVSFFVKAGYSVYNNSIFDLKEHTAENKNPFIPSRTELFTSQTFFDHFKKDVWPNILRILNFKTLLKKSFFENLNYNKSAYQKAIELSDRRDGKPKFVYTHLEMPHFPFYYDSSGKLYPDSLLFNQGAGDVDKYVQYLKYTNTQLANLVNVIIGDSINPPVVILMSDHGYRLIKAGKERCGYSNLFSVYLPDKNYKAFSDSICNVNAFRAVLNSAFGQEMPMLENKIIKVGN